MDEEWKRTIDDLGRVWPRVSGREPPPPPPERGPEHRPPPPPKPEPRDTETLAELIRREAAAEQRYRALARRTGGAASASLRRLAAGSGCLAKRLQREYFLRAGDTCPVPRTRLRVGSLHEELRRAWADARSMEQAYLDAAGKTRDNSLAALYGDAAEQKQREQRTLHQLAGRLIT